MSVTDESETAATSSAAATARSACPSTRGRMRKPTGARWARRHRRVETQPQLLQCACLVRVRPEVLQLSGVRVERRVERLNRERECIVGELQPPPCRERGISRKCSRAGEPLISACPSLSPPSNPSINGPKRCPNARISPEPPLPCAGTRGSGSPSSRAATASTRRGLGRVPADQVREPGEDDPARDALRKRFAERSGTAGGRQSTAGGDPRRRADPLRGRHSRSSRHRSLRPVSPPAVGTLRVPPRLVRAPRARSGRARRSRRRLVRVERDLLP